MRTIVTVDQAKHGDCLANHSIIRPDVVVDSHDPERVIEIIRRATKGKVRFGIVTQGK